MAQLPLSGGHSTVEPPLPIPNRTVKRCRAHDSGGPPPAKVGHRQTPIPSPPIPPYWGLFFSGLEGRTEAAATCSPAIAPRPRQATAFGLGTLRNSNRMGNGNAAFGDQISGSGLPKRDVDCTGTWGLPIVEFPRIFALCDRSVPWPVKSVRPWQRLWPCGSQNPDHQPQGGSLSCMQHRGDGRVHMADRAQLCHPSQEGLRTWSVKRC